MPDGRRGEEVPAAPAAARVRRTAAVGRAGDAQHQRADRLDPARCAARTDWILRAALRERLGRDPVDDGKKKRG